MTPPISVETFHTDMAAISRARHTAKAYQSMTLSNQEITDLLDLLRFSSSSVNSQPWHLIVATTEGGRDRIAKAGMDEKYPFNSDSVRKAGMVVVFASRLEADQDYQEMILAREDQDGRFPDPSKKEEMRNIRSMFIDLNRSETDPGAKDWMAHQVYWNGGQFLHGVAAMGLDATPMEGIDTDGLDQAFGLTEKGYQSLFVVTVGRNADEQDWNYSLPKSRLPISHIATQI